MGHCEGASGLAGLVKVLLSMQHGTIPANLHYAQPREDIPSLHNGRIEVVTDLVPFTEGLAALSSFGFGGSNTHVVLEKIPEHTEFKQDRGDLYPIPYAARTSQGLAQLRQEIKDELENLPQLSAVLSNIYKTPLEKYPHKGFMLANREGDILVDVESTAASRELPVWLVLNGVGSQWNGMGKALLAIPFVKEVLQKCHETLKERHNFDLIEVLTSPDEDTFNSPVNIFTSIAAVQISLYEMLKKLDMRVDGFFGHSIGEIVCAYIDEVLDFEQTLDIAYVRGKAVAESQHIKGAMLAVSMKHKDLIDLLPEGIEVACFNTRDSFTLSGPEEPIIQFGAYLDEKDIMAKVVNTGGIPFHSRYIENSRKAFTKYLSPIIKNPKQRSSQWISSSRDIEAWEGEDRGDIRYFIDNLLEPVYFQRCLEHIKGPAIVLEIGPHGLLQRLLKAQLPECRHFSLLQREDETATFFWQQMGMLSASGVAFDWTKLFPASDAGNALLRIKNLCSWNHDTTWELPKVSFAKSAVETDFIDEYAVDIDNPDNAYIKDHIVNGNAIIPGVGYLYMAWQSLAKWKKTSPEALPLEFKNIQFIRASIFRNTQLINLTFKYDSLNESFYFFEGAHLVCKGQVDLSSAFSLDTQSFDKGWCDSEENLGKDDIYKLFVKTGIEYGNLFRGIALVSAKKDRALVDFTHNWPTYFDAVLQLLFVNSFSETIGVPRRIDSFKFDPRNFDSKEGIPAVIDESNASVRTPLIQIEGVVIHSNYEPKIEPYKLHAIEFKPYHQQLRFEAETEEYLELCRQIVSRHLNRIFNDEDLGRFSDLAHLEKIKHALGNELGSGEYSEAIYHKYADHPKAKVLQFVEYIFSNWEDLLEDAMPLIFSFSDYKASYRDDFAFAQRAEIIENMLELILRNSDTARINAIEIGAGTGALTSVALPYLSAYNAAYCISDVSTGYFTDLENEFAPFSAGMRFAVWDANHKTPDNKKYDLIMGSNAIHTVANISTTLNNICEGLTEDGYCLIEEMTGNHWYSLGIWGFIRDFWKTEDARTCGMYLSQDKWIEKAEEAGMQLVMSANVGGSLSYLLFKKMRRHKPNRLFEVSNLGEENGFSALKTALLDITDEQTLWVLGNKDNAPGLDGLVRCLAHEHPQAVRGIFIEDDGMPSQDEIQRAIQADLISNVWKNGQMGSYFRRDWDGEVLRNGTRVLKDNYQIRALVPGDLQSIKKLPEWRTSNAIPKATVKCFPLNFKDVMLASGKISSSIYKPFGEPIGLEFSGTLDDGTRIIGLNFGDHGIASRVRADNPDTFWKLPEHWSFEQGCTVPVAYTTAYAGIVVKGQARKGQSVFIHSGAGAVGQAAIKIAFNLGLEVFTTTGSEEKTAFLLERFPELKRDHVLYSRTGDFKQAILELTHGRGVDIVLNSFSGEQMLKSLDVLAAYGQFVDISRYDADQNNPLPMKYFLNNISFHNIALDQMYRDRHPAIKEIHHYIDEGLKNGEVIPLCFKKTDSVVEGVKDLLKGNTIGKLVLDMDEIQESLERVDVFSCDPDKSYIVTGGLGGVGLEFCQWLCARGARRLHIVTRSKRQTPYQNLKIEQWRRMGADISISHVDLTDTQQAEQFVKEAQESNPVGGIFHLAMVLNDKRFTEQTYPDFQEAVNVKVKIAENLDRWTRAYCGELDHFVLFSSVITFYGNEGQSNYAYGNSMMERLCEQRQRDALPGLAIQWGALGDVGFVARSKIENSFAHFGIKAMGILSVLDSLDKILCGNAAVVSSHAPRVIEKAKEAAETKNNPIDDVLQIMGFQSMPDEFEGHHSFTELGVDSLMVVEINQVLSRNYNINLGLRQIRELTFDKLNEYYSAGDSTDQDEDRVDEQSMIPFYSINDPLPQQCSSTVCYYLDGTFLNPATTMKELEKDADTSYFYIPYHQGIETIAQLKKAFNEHLGQLPPHVNNVLIYGFSFGAVLAGILGEEAGKLREGVKIKGYAVPNEIVKNDLYEYLQNKVNDGATENCLSISESIHYLKNHADKKLFESDFLNVIKDVFFFGNPPDHLISYEDILNLLWFIYNNRNELAIKRFDEIVIYEGDPLSLSKDDGIKVAQKISTVNSQHSFEHVQLRQ